MEVEKMKEQEATIGNSSEQFKTEMLEKFEELRERISRQEEKIGEQEKTILTQTQKILEQDEKIAQIKKPKVWSENATLWCKVVVNTIVNSQ